MKRRPWRGAGAHRCLDWDPSDDPGSSAPASDPQAQRCAGCGASGQPPTIVWDKGQAPPGVTLTPVFGWHEDPGRPALLCPMCKGRLKKNRGRVRYSKPRSSDRRIVS